MKKTYGVLRHLTVLLICLLCMSPFLVLLNLSLNTPQHNLYEDSLIVPDFYFGNYAEGWVKSNIGRAMVNSGIIAFAALAVIVLLGAMAGYTVARFPNRFNRMVFSVLLGCMMIPGIINTVPLYTLMIRIKAVNTLWGMALVCATLALPQAVFVFSGFIQSIPKELEEAAIIDGCSYFTSFWRVVFPLLKPSVAAVVILNVFGIWNNYSQAVFFLQSSEKHNVPQALSVYFQQFAGAQWNLMAATAVIAIIPVVAVFLVFQKRIMSGLTEGAIKG